MIERLLRFAISRPVLIGMGGLLAGCGAGLSISAHGATPSPGAPITRAQATSYAHAVNLHPRDVPGMNSESSEEPEEPANPSSLTELSLCAGGAQRVVNVSSPTFGSERRPVWVVFSDVRVVPSEALANTDIAALHSVRGRACFGRSLGGSSSRVTVTSLPVAQGDTALRSKIAPKKTIEHGVRTETKYLDYFSFAVGPAEIELITLGVSRPAPWALEQRLLALLHRRAVAYTL